MTKNEIPQPSRSATAFEEGVMRKILAADEKLGRFAEQVSGAAVGTIDDYGSICIRPVVAGAEAMAGPVRKLAAEGQAKDSDEIDVHFLLFEQNGRLCELQIYKDDGSPIQRRISVDDLEILVLR
jgi:hypothetical protein